MTFRRKPMAFFSASRVGTCQRRAPFSTSLTTNLVVLQRAQKEKIERLPLARNPKPQALDLNPKLSDLTRHNHLPTPNPISAPSQGDAFSLALSFHREVITIINIVTITISIIIITIIFLLLLFLLLLLVLLLLLLLLCKSRIQEGQILQGILGGSWGG